MKRAHRVIVHACSLLAGWSGAPIIGMAVIWMAATPRAAWGQWTGGPTGPIYYNGGNVGIGTTNPAYTLHVWGPLYAWDMYVGNTNGSAGGVMRIDGWMDYLHLWSSANTGVRIGNDVVGTLVQFNPNGSVGIGTTNPQYLLSVNGTIGAKDVIVTNTGWSDYVFRPGYRLRPLSEVSQFIEQHHHLPDIPTEAEVKAKGVSLGDMQAKLLAKVEELTLHLIQQEKGDKQLRERLAQLENRVAARSGVASGR